MTDVCNLMHESCFARSSDFFLSVSKQLLDVSVALVVSLHVSVKVIRQEHLREVSFRLLAHLHEGFRSLSRLQVSLCDLD